MIRVTYKITGEYDDYATIEVSEDSYDVISNFISNLNANSSTVQIKEIKKEIIEDK